MLGILKKILSCLAISLLIFVFTGCGKDSDKKTPAVKTISRYTLAYTAEDNGSIDGPSPQTVIKGGNGSMVTAVPAAGYHFVKWSDRVTTASRTDSYVKADVRVSASFAPNRFTLTYTAGDNGSIEGNSVQTVLHGGDGIPVTAIPAEHYHFAVWSDGVTTATRTDRHVTADLELKADFAVDQYTLTYSVEGNGVIKGTNPQNVPYGGSGNGVTAVPETGYHFVKWSDGVTTANRTDANVKAEITVTAEFACRASLPVFMVSVRPSHSVENVCSFVIVFNVKALKFCGL